MKITKQKDPRYPIKVTFSNKRWLQLVLQRKLKKGSCLRRSGCSIISEYEALQWLGKHRKEVMPTYLLEWHRKHTPQLIKGKLTMRGVEKGIAHFGKGLCTMKFYRPEQITLKLVKKLLKAGCLIIFEHKAPHTFLLAYDDGKFWLLDKGKCRVTHSLPVLVKRKNKTKTYGGMIALTAIEEEPAPKKPAAKKPATKKPATKKPTKKKATKKVAQEVMDGKWGNYPERKKKLEAAGYNYEEVRALVNGMVKK